MKNAKKMKPLRLLTAAAPCAGACVGGEWWAHRSEQANIEAGGETEIARIENDAEKTKLQSETVRERFQARPEVFDVAYPVGRDGV